MNVESFQPTLAIQATPEAVQHIRKQLELNPEARGFRLGIRRSGCSGYMYTVGLVEASREDDQVFRLDEGVDIFIDAASLPIINGTTIDFVKDGLNRVFRFDNPNMAASCGCGESFSISEPQRSPAEPITAGAPDGT